MSLSYLTILDVIKKPYYIDVYDYASLKTCCMFQLQSLSDNIHQKEVKVYKSCMQRNILLLFPLVLSNVLLLISMHSSAVCAS